MITTDEKLRELLAAVRTPEVQEQHRLWLAERPPCIRELAGRYPFDRAYRVKSDARYGGTAPGAIVAIVSYMESGTVTCRVFRDPPGHWTSGEVRWEFDPTWLEPYDAGTSLAARLGKPSQAGLNALAREITEWVKETARVDSEGPGGRRRAVAEALEKMLAAVRTPEAQEPYDPEGT